MAHDETLLCGMPLERLQKAVPQRTSRDMYRLRDMALAVPKDRDLIVEILEGYENSDTSAGKAASNSISTILAISMLEILGEE